MMVPGKHTSGDWGVVPGLGTHCAAAVAPQTGVSAPVPLWSV